MNTLTSPRASAPVPVARSRWYREPWMWLVVGGPLAVVLASVVTLMLALKNPDPVLDRSTEVQRRSVTPDGLTDEERAAALVRLQPAHKARNHAASPLIDKP